MIIGEKGIWCHQQIEKGWSARHIDKGHNTLKLNASATGSKKLHEAKVSS